MLAQQRRGRSQSSLAAWQGFALVLLLTAAALLYVKFQTASKRRVLLADIDVSLQQAATFSQSAQAQQQAIDQLQQQVTDLQHQVDVLGSCLLPGDAIWRPNPPPGGQLAMPAQHKAAILVPYRDREQQLSAFLPQLSAFLLNQGRQFDIFVIEQTPGLHFNRGALLNAGVLLLQASAYDYFIFHDVDTIPMEAGNIPYAYPEGLNPLHLTPPGIHPKGIRYEDFFGGIAAFSTEQMNAVNGFGTNFWGWGREDDNMRERLLRLGRWPPQKPEVNMNKGRRFYFKHAPHVKALEVRMSKSATSNATEYSAVNPDRPYKKSLIVSSQPENFLDFKTGLNTTAFRVVAVQPIASLAVRYIVDLHCDRAKTPWCADTHP